MAPARATPPVPAASVATAAPGAPAAGRSARPAALAAGLSAMLLASLALAGCLGPAAGPGAAPGSPAGVAAAMLARPPGSGVEPTGRTVTFDLYLHRMTHELYPGATMAMWGFSLSDDPATAQVPGPELRVTEGDRVVVNFLSTVEGFDHTLHWHGQHVPWRMDGVPFLTEDPIPAGVEATYTFVARPAGTYWYHCHVDAAHHVDMGMYGPLIVLPQDPAADPPADREAILMLDEMDRFHLEGGQPAAGNQPQGGDPFATADYLERQAQEVVGRNPAVHGAITGTPARPARDWYPVTYAPYRVERNTYLINGHAFPHTEPLFIDRGEVLRLRLIHAGDEMHALHLHGHHMLVTHKDGVALAAPYWADTLAMAPGERYDVHVRGDNPGVWALHDHFGRAVQNDDIFPGGMHTMLVYEERRGDAGGHHGAAGLDPARHSGAWLRTHG